MARFEKLTGHRIEQAAHQNVDNLKTENPDILG